MGSSVLVWYKGIALIYASPHGFHTESSFFHFLLIQLLDIFQTIALIAVREGVVQLGAVHKVLPLLLSLTHTPNKKMYYIIVLISSHSMELKVIEDLSYVVLLRKKFSYIESIPGVLLPHPSSSAYPYKVDGGYGAPEQWHFQGNHHHLASPQGDHQLYDNHHHHFNNLPLKITPSMSSLEALLSKLPSVVPPTQQQQQLLTSSQQQRPLEFMGTMHSNNQKVTKEELDEEVYRPELDIGESSSSMPGYHHFQQDHSNNITRSGGKTIMDFE